MEFYKKNQRNEYGQLQGMPVNQNSDISIGESCLQGDTVALYAINHVDDLEHWENQIWHTVCTEPDLSCWTYLAYSGFREKAELIQTLQHNFYVSDSIHYLIVVNQHVVGWVALMNMRPEHGVIEIGNVYFSHLMKKSTASTEVIYLLLDLCFQKGFRRIEWKCDDLNVPSKQAALRFGFSFEGLFRQDRIIKGCNRNTAWYSILDEEWPALKMVYQKWLSKDNFDEQGQQKVCFQDFKKQAI